jgi:hypothetical protein
MKRSVVTLSGRLCFALCISSLAFLWLVMLPWLSAQPGVAGHLKWLDDHRIDANAMFYTELEALEPVLHRLERSR